MFFGVTVTHMHERHNTYLCVTIWTMISLIYISHLRVFSINFPFIINTKKCTHNNIWQEQEFQRLPKGKWSGKQAIFLTHTSHVRYSNSSQWVMYESVDDLWLPGGHMLISMLGFMEMLSTLQRDKSSPTLSCHWGKGTNTANRISQPRDR